MFKNYLKIAFRNLRRYRAYSFINICGLAVGIACCLLILSYVRNELSYDRFHEKAGRIFRVLAEMGLKNEIEIESANTSFPIGPALKQTFPEVLEAVRFRQAYQAVVSYGEKHFAEGKFYFVDPAVFEMFSFPFAQGDPATALAQPNTVVLTESAARKYFGDEAAIGKTLSYKGSGGPRELTVSGILRDLPHNTHFDFDFLASMQSLDTADLSWTWFTSLWTYVLLPENYPPQALADKFPAFIEQYLPENDRIDVDETMVMALEPLTGIHLRSRLDKQMKPEGDIAYITLFSIIAAFILLIACINFTNLATARALKRAKEVGLRKTLGAQRRELIGQFLGEAFLYSGLALLLAIALLELALPWFGKFTGKPLGVHYFNDGFVAASLLGILLFAGLAAGSYPAFILSRFRPAQVLKNARFTTAGQGAGLRKALVVFQFGISVTLILGSLVVSQQLKYIRSKNLGANIDQVVVIPYTDSAESLLQALRQNPRVLSATASSRVPVNIESFDTRPIRIEGFDKPLEMENFNIDENFLETYKIDLVAGRNLSREFATDSSAFLINEAAVKYFGWDSPQAAIDKRLGWQNGFRWGQIVGVVKDFHLGSFHETIGPLVMTKLPEHYWYNFISVRVQPERISETLRFLETTWRRFEPEGGYEYFFVDESFARLHRADEKFGQVFGGFTVISILIAGLGLFGLAAFSAEQRTREIGIRKVLGATAANLVALLSRDFIKLVLLANVIAWPLAWFAMNRWLEDFAYRIEIGWWIFLLSGGLALLIALLTISYQAIRAALANPVESLRYE